MGASVSYKLKNSIQGALAGGGDPATSPLYVFGPFLAFIAASGVAKITFGASIWLAVFTVIAVSTMYRYVMIWVTDGSGGSGLSEEEFGSWAVKVNASVTVIEYTLTFLVSMAALVTFIADRVPVMGLSVWIFDLRTVIAIILSLAIVLAVNRGPRVSAAFFGPATALILIFLWLMNIAVVINHGLVLPGLNPEAFHPNYLHFTLGGFARILALMTGIEIFANLVASYEGNAAQRSGKAFGSLVIVMGTTVSTMLIVGPAIMQFSDPTLVEKSVFTQTMDAILPPWLSYTGSLIGIAVLLSAAAASMQGMQNLAMGLRARHYLPARWGARNRFDVPSTPAWIQAGIVITAFLLFGTHEETYLALYAAGVFILLSMTGWACAKRFLRLVRSHSGLKSSMGLAVSIFSALLASFATMIIFAERFTEGAWSYLVMIPVIYIGFDFFRRRLGPPPMSLDGHLSSVINAVHLNVGHQSETALFKIRKILVPLDGAMAPEFAFHQANRIANRTGAAVEMLYVDTDPKKLEKMRHYLSNLTTAYSTGTSEITYEIRKGDASTEIVDLAAKGKFDLICMSSMNMAKTSTIVRQRSSYKVIYATTPPVLFLRPGEGWVTRASQFKKMLLPMDGSEVAEQVLPYAVAWAREYGSTVTLLSVPEDQGDESINEKMKLYLETIAKKHFLDHGLSATTVVEGSGPARTILHHLGENEFDLIAMVSHGRGGLERQQYVRLGSVTESIFAESGVPILFISAVKTETPGN